MSPFTTPLIVEPISTRRWRLVAPFEYHVGSYPSSKPKWKRFIKSLRRKEDFNFRR